MHRILGIAGVSLVSILICGSAPGAEGAESAQSKSCWSQATQQGLHGEKRDAFHATCVKGALAPKGPTKLAEATRGAKAVVAPSGADRTVRSKQCDAEAARRGLHDAAFESFRKGCLASAAPVSAIENGEHPTRPTPAKPKLESLTNTPPK
jgi:hypothetical protein